ncbi:hypothetical protein SS50377_20887 [Spironucleus salmonicida]|uniref:Uncharacterized protein n=1 Tax=Spironucleus salmonicida TaxID=348837 RepID=V6LGY0_9EUKA|nr:hypothetical protein SS50377_20887 [Spironucleus salmonicida]|eukprot:EST43563.1 Hypothetical protein SS50377_16602 [Spironucleus salmonicida]
MEGLRFENLKLSQEVAQLGALLSLKDTQITQLYNKIEELTSKLDSTSPDPQAKQTAFQNEQILTYSDFSPHSSQPVKAPMAVFAAQESIPNAVFETLLSPRMEFKIEQREDLNALTKFDGPLTPQIAKSPCQLRDILDETLRRHRQKTAHHSAFYTPAADNMGRILEFLRYGARKPLSFEELRFADAFPGHFLLLVDGRLSVLGVLRVQDAPPFALVGIAGVRLEIQQDQLQSCFAITKTGRLRLERQPGGLRISTDAVAI